jgi:hypothetical protein
MRLQADIEVEDDLVEPGGLDLFAWREPRGRIKIVSPEGRFR